MTKKQPPKNSPFGSLVLVLIFALAFTACGEKQQAASPPATPAAVPPAVAVSSTPPKPVQSQLSSALRLPPPAVNQFDFSTKKDPFKPFVALKLEPKGPKNSFAAMRAALPIHSFDVSQFKLIGIITGGNENKAMVTDPGGKGYVLKVGMLIGKNDGKVVSITTSGVSILEQFKDDNGRVRKENIKLSLPKKQ